MSGFEDFSYQRIKVRSAALGRDLEIAAYKAGSGPGLLLLHGFPQTHYIWNKVAKRLSEKYTVVATDLRGYGASDKPKGSESHVEYSKREMANDQVQVMKHFGLDSFHIMAHDRGARVAHRLALDHPDKVKKMILLDIAPTLWMYEHTSMEFATGYWHWFFLIQQTPGPEEMIMSGPEAFWGSLERRVTHSLVAWSDEAVAEYKRAFFTPETVHGACEDYRAAATIDLEHDRADRSAGRKLRIPALKVLWGKQGMIERMGGAVEVFKGYCDESVEVSGRSVESGHYIPEEVPEDVLSEATGFFV